MTLIMRLNPVLRGFLIAAAVTLPVSAQTRIVGLVSNNSGQPEAGVVVSIYGNGVRQSAWTDAEGKYEIRIPLRVSYPATPLTFRLTAHRDGLKSTDTLAIIQKHRTTTFNLVMVVGVDEIVIAGDGPTLSVQEPDAVRAALTRLTAGHDRRDWDAFWGTFAADPRVSFPFGECSEEVVGRDAIEARFRAHFARNPPDERRLVGGDGEYFSPMRGDSVRVRLMPRQRGPGGFDGNQPGLREFVFVKEDGSWKVARMHVLPYYYARSDACQ